MSIWSYVIHFVCVTNSHIPTTLCFNLIYFDPVYLISFAAVYYPRYWGISNIEWNNSVLTHGYVFVDIDLNPNVVRLETILQNVEVLISKAHAGEFLQSSGSSSGAVYAPGIFEDLAIGCRLPHLPKIIRLSEPLA